HKNAGLWMCLFALTSSLKSAFLFLSFPGFREEPKKTRILGEEFGLRPLGVIQRQGSACQHRSNTWGVCRS
ncbi:MAG: hypothetical protein CMK75_07595, partial [Pseudomonadales bacterium]|nr:hypothetical protein [Pseudomonadales bacterium]